VAAPATSGTVALSATSTVPALSVSANALAMSTTVTSKTLTVSSSGSAPLAINNIFVNGQNPGQFSQTNTCPVGGTLAAGSTCTVTVKFTRTGLSTATRQAVLHVNVAGPAVSAQVALSGTVP
jgi:hypothetical protein